MQSDQEEEPAVKDLDGAAALSNDEFRRMQEQLIELRNLNYELIEKNKQLQAQGPKSNEAFRFATKFMGRKTERQVAVGKWEEEINSLRAKLTTQEEEFRLQQSTLLTELNKVIVQNKDLEKKVERFGKGIITEGDGGGNDEVVTSSQNGRTEQELEKEIAWLKGVLAEKDSLVEDIEILNKDVLRAKDAESERANAVEKKCALLEKQLSEKKRTLEELEETMKIKTEENLLLKSRYEDFCKEKYDKFRDASCQCYECFGESKFCDQEMQCEHLEKNAVVVQTDSDFMDEHLSLQGIVADIKLKYEELLEERKKCEMQVNDLTASNKEKLEEVEVLKKISEDLRVEILQHKNSIRSLKDSERVFMEERNEWREKEKNYVEKIQEIEFLSKETNSKWEQEMSSLQKNYKDLESKLELECKQGKEKLKAKDQEMHVALKKQSSMVRELRRQVQQEKKRADQAEKQLEEVLGSGRHYRITGGSPLVSSDHSRADGRNGIEGSSSVCSWAFGAEIDRRSTHTFDGDESSCSASVLESDNVELIIRLAQLQKKHSETLDRLTMLEEENMLLRKEVAEKNEVIAEWIRTRPCGDSGTSSSPSVRIRRMFDIVRLDDSAADIRDMNRKLQRMLEETLSKNLNLQKDIQRLLENGKTDAVK